MPHSGTTTLLEEKEEERGRLDLRRLADQHWADIDVSNDQSSSTFDDLTRDWPYLAVCCLAWIRVVPMYMYKGPGGLMDCLIQSAGGVNSSVQGRRRQGRLPQYLVTLAGRAIFVDFLPTLF